MIAVATGRRRVAVGALALALALASMAGCGDLVGSCVSVNAPEHTCTEVHGAVKAADVDSVRLALCGNNQVWSSDACINGNSIGACSSPATSPQGVKLTLEAFYFPSDMLRTTSDVKARCKALHGSYSDAPGSNGPPLGTTSIPE